jgi:hypothetical protein
MVYWDWGHILLILHLGYVVQQANSYWTYWRNGQSQECLTSWFIVHPMRNSLIGMRANEGLPSTECKVGISVTGELPTLPLMYVNLWHWKQAWIRLLQSDLLLCPLKMTPVCSECENAELRMWYMQYKLYSLPKIKVILWSTTGT